MSQVVTSQGWRCLGPVPRMHEWESVQAIVLPSETAAIYRIWKGRDDGNKALPVCWETLGSGEKPKREKKKPQLGVKTMLLRALTFPVYISEKTPAPFYVVSNAFLVNGLVCNNLLSDNELI